MSVPSVQVRVSQLTIPARECKKYIRFRMASSMHKICVKVLHTRPESDQMSYMPLDVLNHASFVSMVDISSPSKQQLYGQMIWWNMPFEYIITSSNNDVIVNLIDDDGQVNTRLVLPLSMDPRSHNAIYIPQDYSKQVHTIPNEFTWEFLHCFYKWNQMHAKI